jgi:hypothetical protein
MTSKRNFRATIAAATAAIDAIATRAAAPLLFALPILFLLWTVQAFAQGPGNAPVPAAATATPSAALLKNWRHGMARATPSQAGCFTSSYPSTQWQEVPCLPGPTVPNDVGSGPRLGVSTGSLISTAVGSFDSVGGVTSITSIDLKSGNPVFDTLPENGDYTLQLNTNTFTPSLCANAQPPDVMHPCEAWQQFIFSQGQCGDTKNPVPCAFIEYWLYNWGATNPIPCPSGLKLTKHGNCFGNRYSVPIPPQTLANLGSLSVTAVATAGGMDAVIFSSGNNLYMHQELDSMLYLAASWTEFNYDLVGDGNSSQAVFNSDSSEVATITVRASVDSVDSSGRSITSAPTCVPPGQYHGGDTGETNTLYLQPAGAPGLGTLPALVYTESSTQPNPAPTMCPPIPPATTPPGAASLLPAASKLTDTHDLNGDGFSDIVWLDSSTSSVAVWLMDAAQVLVSGSPGTAPTSTSSIVGQRDFNGDGTYDLLWQDTNSGDISIWFMNGTQVVSVGAVGSVSAGWSVVGVADFNLDGKGDLLWQDGQGDTSIWLMNGASLLVPPVSLGTIPTKFTVAGTGDFNGDGVPDILWHDNTSGDMSIWFMQVANSQVYVGSSAPVGNIPTTWSVVGTGDFNGDGMTDIAWRDTAGDTAIWLMSGASVLSAGGLGNVPTTFSIALVGDYNGDGKSDLLWQDNLGDTSIWFMNGTAVSSTASLGNIPTTWTIQSANAE